ncbi:hypothetical protein Q9233_010967, partial [Columba guinea]
VNYYSKIISNLGNAILFPISLWLTSEDESDQRSEKIIETFDIHDTCNNSIIYITENGFSQSDPALLDDSQRWDYFMLILQEILKGTILNDERSIVQT